MTAINRGFDCGTMKEAIEAQPLGIHPGMSRADYDAIKAVNVSLLLSGPTHRHRKAVADGHGKTSDAMEFGLAYHCFILEPDRFATDYHVFSTPPNRKSDWGKEYWGKIEAGIMADVQDEKIAAKEAEKLRKEASLLYDVAAKKHGPDKMISPEEHATFVAMREALGESKRTRALCAAPGLYECAIVWRDKTTGLLCKGMLDKLIDKIGSILDLKRAVSADDWAFGSAAAKLGYDVRGAWYIDAIYAITGQWYDYTLMPQEPEYPYLSAMYRIERGDEEYKAGRWKYRQTLNGWAQCLKTGVFPGYGDQVRPLMMPKYAYPMDMIDEQEETNDEPSTDTNRTPGKASGASLEPANSGDAAQRTFGVDL